MANRRSYRGIALLVLAAILMIIGCNSEQDGDAAGSAGKTRVVASFYPLYDFAKKIGGEHIEVVNLVPAGVEPHDWTPKSRDLQQLSAADLFIYLGDYFDGWVTEALAGLGDKKPPAVEAGRGIELLHSAEHGHDRHADPHVWLNPRLAKTIAANIVDVLVQVDPDHRADYENNFAALADRLDDLHKQYKEALGKTEQKAIVTAHRSFAYLAAEYGLTQKSVMGLSHDAEPTAREIRDIRAFIRENGIRQIFTEKLISAELAESIAADLGIDTVVLDPLEGLTEAEMQAGEDYFSVMESNLQKLVRALGG